MLLLLDGLWILHIVAPERPEIANVEPAVGDHWIGPGHFLLVIGYWLFGDFSADRVE